MPGRLIASVPLNVIATATGALLPSASIRPATTSPLKAWPQ